MAASGFPRFRPVAEHSLLAEFGDVIADDIHAQVLQLDRALAAAPFPGMLETVPAYAALLVRFDPLLTDHDAVAAALGKLAGQGGAAGQEPALHDIGVCYDGDLAPDLASVAEATGLGTDAVIAAHLAADYKVYMYGFSPGYAYMAGTPGALQLPRKPAAVRGVPAGSVLIAGPQCIVSTVTMPTGWWIIGRSPTRILTGDPDRPFLFEVGDHIRFHRISRDTFEAGGTTP